MTKEKQTALVKPDNGKNSELSVLKKNDFVLSKYDPQQLRDVVLSNFDDDELTPNDLEKIHVPSGGQKVWLIPSVDGDEKASKTLNGIILMVRTRRAYWPEKIDDSGGGVPPQCNAPDGKLGLGDPGGICKECPLNAFGSDGRGKACKEMRLVFLLQPGSLLPVVVVIPPTGIQPLKKYMTQLTGAAIPYSDVITEIALAEKQNKDGIKFSSPVFRKSETLDPLSAKHVRFYADSLKEALSTATIAVTSQDAHDVE